MKKRISRIITALAAYIFLNAGVLGWARVFQTAENRINAAQTAMADISTGDDHTAVVSILGESRVLDLSFADSDEFRMCVLSVCDPVVSAAAELLRESGIFER